MSVNIVLPACNGDIEGGLAVGTDPSPIDARKLRVVTTGTRELMCKSAIACAYTMDFGCELVEAKSLLVNAAWGLTLLGFIRSENLNREAFQVGDVGVIPSSDWVSVAESVTLNATQSSAASALLSEVEMRKAMTIFLATKANWWTMNHHTGQGAMVGYAKKVALMYYKPLMEEALLETTTSIIHTIGHWGCTRFTLTLAQLHPGIPTIEALRRSEVIASPPKRFVVSVDSQLRFKSYPAGTHQASIAKTILTRLAKTTYIFACPDAQSFSLVTAFCDKVEANMEGYHVGSMFLNGTAPVDSATSLGNAVLGRLGTYMFAFAPNASIMSSPHLDKGRIQSYEDHSAEWVETLAAIKKEGVRSTQAAKDYVGHMASGSVAATGLMASLAITPTGSQLAFIQMMVEREAAATAEHDDM